MTRCFKKIIYKLSGFPIGERGNHSLLLEQIQNETLKESYEQHIGNLAKRVDLMYLWRGGSGKTRKLQWKCEVSLN